MELTGKTPAQLTGTEVIAHLNRSRELKQLSSSSLNTRICGIKYYYRRVLHRLDMAIDIPNPRRIKQAGDLLTPVEMDRLFLAARSIRHLAVLHLLYDTGLRAREAGRLRLGDFDSKSRCLTVRFGKGGRHRTVPYGEALRHTLNVCFRYKDYRQGGKVSEMTLGGVEFLRRFSQHILPPGFRRMRHYGILSNALKGRALAACRRSLGLPTPRRPLYPADHLCRDKCLALKTHKAKLFPPLLLASSPHPAYRPTWLNRYDARLRRHLAIEP
jgi:integrase